MSYILHRKVKKAIYVYECTSYRNKDGKPRSRQRYLGRLDSDGVLITKKRRLPAQIKEVKLITKKFILEPYSKRVNNTETPIPMNNGSTGKFSNADKIAASGERITDAKTLRLFTLPFSHRAQVRGINTTHALNVIDRKPKSLIA